MKTLFSLALLTAALATARAQVISWNYDDWSTIQPDQTAGVVPAANWTDTWLNNVTVDLPDNTGAPTTLDLGYGSFNSWHVNASHPGQDADGSYNRELLNGYLNAGLAAWGPSITNSYVTLSEIPYSQYDIYVYFNSDVEGRAGHVTDGATTFFFSTVGPASVSGANALFLQTTDTTGTNPTADYAIFSGLTGSSQTITVQMHELEEWGGIAGFQVVAVPEPSVLGLLLVGSVGLLVRRRRA